MKYEQLFIDCMPGPTYHFGGHSFGNLASMKSKSKPSNPKATALEWLNKIEKILELGSKQIVLPPQRRPLYGFNKQKDIRYLSCAHMWMANSGHFTPSCDTKNNTAYFTPSNMNTTKHRCKEHYFNKYWIQRIFQDEIKYTSKLIGNDEGAANTIRLSNKELNKGLNVYVYGDKNSKYPCRQDKISTKELIKKHQVKDGFIIQQSLDALNQGVFHNDVISFGIKDQLFCHKYSFKNQEKVLNELKEKYFTMFDSKLSITEIDNITLKEAIQTYLFNSQIVLIKKKQYLLCPLSVKKNNKTYNIVKEWEKQNKFHKIHFISLHQSLLNGGGPACMRLAIYLNKTELSKITKNFLVTSQKIKLLKELVNTLYPKILNDEIVKNSKEIIKKIEANIFL